METDFHLICEDSRQFDFLLGWTLFKELSMRNACDTAPLTAVFKGKFFALHLKSERSSCETAEIRQFCKAFLSLFVTKIAAMLQRVHILL